MTGKNKTYSFGSWDKTKDKMLTLEDIYKKSEPENSILHDYQKKFQDDLYGQYFNNICNEVSLPHSGTTSVWSQKSKSLTYQEIKDMVDLWGGKSKIYDYKDPYETAPLIYKTDKKVDVTMDDGTIESISREELIKYIGEQRVVRENEVVRKVYERYQVAVKLVRSDDYGDTGV